MMFGYHTLGFGAGNATVRNPGFSIKLWSGTGGGTTQVISGVGFEPDLVIIKERNATNFGPAWKVNPDLDSDFSESVYLDSSSQLGRQGDTGSFDSFDADGFTLGDANPSQYNEGARTYIGYAFDESSMYGFDIVTYTGTGAAQNVSHNAGGTPNMIIIRRGDTIAAADWVVYHSGMGISKYGALNSGAVFATDSGSIWNATSPTASVFTVGTDVSVNASGVEFVAFIWRNVTGKLDLGSYTGNGTSSGPIVSTGFKPRFVLIKRASGSSTDDWMIYDSSRDTANPRDVILHMNDSDAEASGSDINFLTIGFQPKESASDVNESGSTYIYMAIA